MRTEITFRCRLADLLTTNVCRQKTANYSLKKWNTESLTHIYMRKKNSETKKVHQGVIAPNQVGVKKEMLIYFFKLRCFYVYREIDLII